MAQRRNDRHAPREGHDAPLSSDLANEEMNYSVHVTEGAATLSEKSDDART
jgi:hypothetical protein